MKSDADGIAMNWMVVLYNNHDSLDGLWYLSAAAVVEETFQRIAFSGLLILVIYADQDLSNKLEIWRIRLKMVDVLRLEKLALTSDDTLPLPVIVGSCIQCMNQDR